MIGCRLSFLAIILDLGGSRSCCGWGELSVLVLLRLVLVVIIAGVDC